MKIRILLCILFLLTGNMLVGQTYNQLGANINGLEFDNLGSSVAGSSDGNIVAIGSPGHVVPTDQLNTGQVKVFELVNNEWVQKGSSLVGEIANDSYGTGLDISDDGNVLVVGAPNSDASSGEFSFAGRVYVYEWDGSDWVLLQTIDATAAQERFGSAISLSSDGSFFAVGVPGAAGGGSGRGAVRVFERTVDTWNKVGGDVNGLQDSETFGTSVSLVVIASDKVLAVGAPAYFTGGNSLDENGIVRIYRESAGSWGTTWAGPETIVGDLNSATGGSVDLSDNGSRLVNGASNGFSNGPNYAEVYEFNASSTPKWQLLGSRINSNLSSDDFGKSVGISGDGTHLIVGAPAFVETGKENGYAKLFKFESTDWAELDSIPGAAASDQFGFSVTINSDGTQYSIGAPSNGAGGASAGQVKTYGLSDVTAPTVVLSSNNGGLTNSNPFSITITFSEAVTGFVATDISVANAGVTNLATSDNTIFTADITPTEDGEYQISILAGAVTDLAGNGNEVSNSLSVTYDGTAPTVTIETKITTDISPSLTGTVNDATASIKLEINETSYSATVEGNTWTASLTPDLAEGSYDVSVTATDALGNARTEVFTTALTIDLTRPTVTIEGAPAETMDEAFGVSFIFSEDVTGFVEGEITVENATLSNFASTDAKTYAATITPNENLAKGDQITINIAENNAQDAASNGNTAASAVSVTYTIKYSGGKGTADDPYLIANEADFRAISDNTEDWSAHFQQTEDITIEDTDPLIAMGYSNNPFRGTYDGTFHSIYNIRAFKKHPNNGSDTYHSLFGEVNGATIKNLSLEAIKMNIDNTLSSISYDRISGLVAYVRSGPLLIENCKVSGEIKIKSNASMGVEVGGLLADGSRTNIQIKNSFTDIEFITEVNGSGEINFGGLVGSLSTSSSSSSIENSYTTSNFTIYGRWSGAFYYGGVTGFNSFDNELTIENVYSAGYLKDEMEFPPNNYGLGGIIGNGAPASITSNVFWDKDISDLENAIRSGNVGGATGYSTAEMRKFSTYSDSSWPIEAYKQGSPSSQAWEHIYSNYPHLSWEREQFEPFTVNGTVVKNGGESFEGDKVFLKTGTSARIETTVDADGNFTISSVEAGFHSLWVESGDDLYEATYLGNTKDARFQKFISYEKEVTIEMVAKPESSQLTGNGTAKGNLVQSTGNTRMTTGRMLDGDPLVGVQVSLVRVEDNEILITVETDENGEYEINGIPAGEYQLLLNLPGRDVNLEGSTFTMDEEGTPIIISAAVSEDGVVFNIEEEVLGIENEIEVSVYPNPVRDFVNVQIPGKAVARIIDVNGTVLKEESFTDNLKLNISELHSNMYFLEISNAKGKAMKKLVKN